MISTAKFNGFLEKYGCEVCLSTDGENFDAPYRAFVQPLRYKNKMYLEGTRTPIGYADQSYYLYVGPGNQDITALPPEGVVKMGDEQFYVSHSEPVRIADQTLYMWAILRGLIKEETND